MKDDDEPKVYDWPEFFTEVFPVVYEWDLAMEAKRDRVVKREGNVLTVDFT